MCSITDKIKLMCKPDDPQHQMLLLAVDLVSDKFTVMNKNIDDRMRHFEGTQRETNKTLHNVSVTLNALNKKIDDHATCPVYKNKEVAEKVMFFAKYPKITISSLTGAAVILLYELYKILIEIKI